ncbi:MAG: hypothetical protein AAF108_02805 [Planctomycetota bacterium]
MAEKQPKTSEDKELAKLHAMCVQRARAADGQLEIAEQRLEELSGQHTEIKASVTETQDAMLEALRGFKGDQPPQGVDVAGLVEDFDRRSQQLETVDRELRRQKNDVRKLTTRVIGLLRSSRKEDPELFETGHGVMLSDLTGDEAAIKELTQASYKTVRDYCTGRKRVIASLVDQGEISREVVADMDRRVYRYLEGVGQTDLWPGDAPPDGEQLWLGSSSSAEDADAGDQGEPGDRETPAEAEKGPELRVTGDEGPAWLDYTLASIPTLANLSEASATRIIDLASWAEDDGLEAINVGQLLDLMVYGTNSWKPRGKAKFRINEYAFDAGLAPMFEWIDAQHKKQPADVYERLVANIRALSPSARGRMREFAGALVDRAVAGES